MADLNQHQRAWLAALRSGMFHQGQSVMRRVHRGQRGTTYCCLGVACEVLGYPLTESRDGRFGVRLEDLRYPVPDSTPEVSQMLLPAEVNEKLGLDHADNSALAQMNDSGWSFEDIAELCRFAWEGGRKVSTTFHKLVELKSWLGFLQVLDPDA